MRTLSLALLFGFIMMVIMLHAGAVKEREQRAKAKRYLLSESGFGRKGMRSDTNEHPMKDSASANTNTAASVNSNKANNNDDTNESYQNYDNGSGPVLNSHHYFHIRIPPING
ncbi:hypothetical protein PHAVU_006G118700 [Phaseolus vulgaris]|uniref:Uncharacterized protein n=1 Tax=Phaseolus vulgaris TaxID=3885 RepID=V7BN42_PHAVU|nr:hypothetical protein PHAVU_006G118700g [Phaseolus vulgaris]XP_007147372.1 hypothetical protein PHAVU_006G118700g [Phaseolus vulgaris]XP_007147373.1 hypothetical protein PHAVU_006G118700g [Phaseolus vulgaris]XP_007147374.1 hypothetical protein PHAVU_006G118700g [Phaseolus vulgaris]ESW19365.1 hypothetical protein PHAVU_006G118700g [Phaseolus vulgaris]ESW19366.1 hypothetical protein PHAVU_006G118700g [Phaseolus vulgaris]ESW19367.1 hypothetical protein PHAVU_006G118700g [Phaseolus vulgaris]ES